MNYFYTSRTPPPEETLWISNYYAAPGVNHLPLDFRNMLRDCLEVGEVPDQVAMLDNFWSKPPFTPGEDTSILLTGHLPLTLPTPAQTLLHDKFPKAGERAHSGPGLVALTPRQLIIFSQPTSILASTQDYNFTARLVPLSNVTSVQLDEAGNTSKVGLNFGFASRARVKAGTATLLNSDSDTMTISGNPATPQDFTALREIVSRLKDTNTLVPPAVPPAPETAVGAINFEGLQTRDDMIGDFKPLLQSLQAQQAGLQQLIYVPPFSAGSIVTLPAALFAVTTNSVMVWTNQADSQGGGVRQTTLALDKISSIELAVVLLASRLCFFSAKTEQISGVGSGVQCTVVHFNSVVLSEFKEALSKLRTFL